MRFSDFKGDFYTSYGLFWVFLIIIYTISCSFLSEAFALSELQKIKSKSLPKSLIDAYSAALKLSETLDIQNELLIQADETTIQSKAALQPTITGTYTYLHQQEPNTSIGQQTSPFSQNTTKLTLSQPMFHALRDFAALRQKKYLREAQKQNLYNAALQLFYSLSTTYYNILVLQEDILNYLIEIEINKKQLKVLESFLRIGRSKQTDVYTFQASIVSLEAQVETFRGSLEAAKEVLTFLTGLDRDTPLEDDAEPFQLKADVKCYLSKAEQRGDIQAAINNLKANEEGVPIAFGQNFPQIDLVGDYYFNRPGALKGVHWDVQLLLSVPLFQGGSIQSQVRQAHSGFRQYERLLSQARRKAEQEIRTFHDAVQADFQLTAKLKKLVEISELNSKTQIRDFKNGLVTNLDILQAITTYQDAKRQLYHQKFITRKDIVQLQASSGEREEINTYINQLLSKSSQ